jgi:hypothetical protein
MKNDDRNNYSKNYEPLRCWSHEIIKKFSRDVFLFSSPSIQNGWNYYVYLLFTKKTQHKAKRTKISIFLPLDFLSFYCFSLLFNSTYNSTLSTIASCVLAEMLCCVVLLFAHPRHYFSRFAPHSFPRFQTNLIKQ